MSGCRESHVVVPRYTRDSSQDTLGFLTPLGKLGAFSDTGNRCSPTPSASILGPSNFKTAEHGGFKIVGLPGIEPGLYAPEAHVLPVYYSPLEILC